MLHFRMDMPLYLMALYGSIMVLFVLLFRGLLKNKLPKFVLPVLWMLVLVRLVVPFSLSSPLSMPVPEWFNIAAEAEVASIADKVIGNAETSVVEGGTIETAVETNEVDSDVEINATETAIEPNVVEDAVTYASKAVEYSSDYPYFPAFNWTFILTMVACIGIVVTAIALLYQKWNYTKKFRDSLLIEHNETINEILRSMDVGHVLVFTNDYIATPLVSGIFNPRIYLPAGMDFKNIQILRHVLTHETMHIKRKDNLIKVVMLLAICLHWYNPLVWFMSKCLSADIEDACDAAVLRDSADDERQNYACSLLAMAISGNRQTLLYSAFSKTEVERRIRSVLRYKRSTALVLVLSIFFMLGSTVVFATGGQAPFSNYLSSYCGHSDCKWAVKAFLTRDIALNDAAGTRADDVILEVMGNDKTSDPEILHSQISAALAQEFGVEKSAFKLAIDLSLDDETLEEEYAVYGITKNENGLYLYQEEPVRIYTDEMLGSVQTTDEGTVDIAIIRDRLGEITSVTVLHEGDRIFDQRTKEREQDRSASTVLEGSIASTVENSVTWIQ